MGYWARELSLATSPGAGLVLQWEETACLLCGSTHSKTLVEGADSQAGTGFRFAVVQCQDCGLCYTNPRLRSECLTRFYPADYRPHQVVVSNPRRRRRRLNGFRRSRPPLPWHGQGRLLDFGCGGGHFLVRMWTHGWQVTGVDNATPTVERLRSETGLRILAGTLPHPELEPGSFDVITMWHALEHVPNPKQVLRAAHRLLAPKGKLLIAAPNIDSLAYRIFGSDWFGLDLPRHLTHFTPWTLQLMLERTGFKVRRIRMVGHSAWLRHSARLACRQPRPRRLHRWLRGKLWSRLLAPYSGLIGQADCLQVSAASATSL